MKHRSILLIIAAAVLVLCAQAQPEGCCSQNYKDCDASWCGNNEEACSTCKNPGEVIWLREGAITTACVRRFDDCSDNPNVCCPGLGCAGPEGGYRQCRSLVTLPPTVVPTPTPPTTDSPTTASPTTINGTSSPTASPSTSTPVQPSTPAPTPSAGVGIEGLFSTENVRSSYDALKELDVITHVIVDDGDNDHPIRTIVAEGGETVLSEGQAYAMMIAGIAVAAMDPNDEEHRQDTMDRFYEYFLGWKKMCVLSSQAAAANCQSEMLCDGGSTACLPGSKFDKDLTDVAVSGSAADADADAITGMMMAVKAVMNDNQKPVWYDEVRKWADASATSFLMYDTEASPTTGQNRIVKLGSCSGGWESDGNSPSYHSPGAYRFMRDYQSDFPPSVRDYAMPSFNDGIVQEERWNKVISTSYKVLDAVQCESNGIVPNWALVKEQNDGSIAPYAGSFSGASGSPQYEFGSEASRTMWRVLFDVALHPWGAFEEGEHFLKHVHNRLDAGYSPGINNWHEQTFMFCHGVDSIYSGWRTNAFIYAPIYSTLVLEASGVPTEEQQEMIDTAGLIVNNISADMTYYARSWSIIGILTLNGDVAKAGANAVRATSNPTASPTAHPTEMPSSDPTTSPTVSPSDRPTEKPSATPTSSPSTGPSVSSSDAPTVSTSGNTSTEKPSAAPSAYPCEESSVKEDCNDVFECSWRSSAGSCKIALTTSECSEWDGNRLKCKRKGCIWKRKNKICKGRWD